MISGERISEREALSLLAKRVVYVSDTGLFYWNADCPERQRGKLAGNFDKQSGYRSFRVKGRKVYAHRLAWFMARGDVPPIVDHRDTNKGNNAIDNLRGASHSQNASNVAMRRGNQTGYKGVTICKRTGKYVAQIMVHGKNKTLGRFDCPIAAHAAYVEAAKAAFDQFARAA